MEQVHSFIHLLFIGVIALFPVVNPIGSAFMVSPYLSRLSEPVKKIAIRKIVLYAFCICMVSLFAGHWVLELFGISIPVIQLGGGIMICKMGWESLSANDKQPVSETKETNLENPDVVEEQVMDNLFYPLTFPITTGAGTISVLFTLSAHSNNANLTNLLINTGAILLSIIIMCLLIYIFYSNTRFIIKRLGRNGEKIMNRIMAFLIFCVGLQIAITGFKQIF
ncbi:MAG: NAAT family transporter [Bacteroidetes bacterium]|nr:NAAT family transporter [Bacteroidota bacterium]